MKRLIVAVVTLFTMTLLFSDGFSQLGGLDPAVSVLNTQLAKYTIKFKYNEYTFTDPQYIKTMDQYAPLIKAVTEKIPSGYALFVLGHASKDGGAEYNQTLSANRAKTVYERLIQAGVAANIMKSVGKGTDIDKRCVTFEVRKN